MSTSEVAPPVPRRFPWLLVCGTVALLGLAVFVSPLLLSGRGRQPVSPEPAKPGLVVEGESVRLHSQAPQWQYLELAVAEEAPALAPLPVPGRVAFDEQRTASVGAPLAGRVDQVRVRLGDKVAAGERLFSVRSGAYAELERELLGAQAAVATSQRKVARLRELVSLQAAPEKELLEAEAELRQAELALQAAQARRASLQVAPEGDNLYWVRAPRSGTVVDLEVVASQEVTPERDRPLVRLSDLDEVLVLADVQETDAADLREGQPATVRTSPGALVRTGKVERISEVVDPLRRTVAVRIRVSNGDRALRPHAFVEVTPQAPEGVHRVLVPDSAVVTNGARSVVFVAREGGRLERVPVTPGRRREGQVELRQGLAAGSRYVARGALLLENQIELAN